MTLDSFQRALGDLIASPKLCLAMRNKPDEILAHYDLTPREQRRLIAVVNQRGMSTSCTLYRANRLTAIYTLLPLSCVALGNSLKGELELYCDMNKSRDLQFRYESERFAHFLAERIARKQLQNPYVMEIIEFELAKYDLVNLSQNKSASNAPGTNEGAYETPDTLDSHFALHPYVRLVLFRHDPTTLFTLLNKMEMPAYDLPEDTYFLLLDARQQEMVIKLVDKEAGFVLQKIKDEGKAPHFGQEYLMPLLKEGILGKWESSLSANPPA